MIVISLNRPSELGCRSSGSRKERWVCHSPMAGWVCRRRGRRGAAAAETSATETSATETSATETSQGVTSADAARERTRLAWTSGGRRHPSTTTQQKHGKAPDASCAHDGWCTYEGATKWWIRCERCEGRLAEGRVVRREKLRVLEGWTPPGVAGQATVGQEVTLTGAWTCGLCKSELQQGTASVLTGVGRICIPCRTGPGRRQAPSEETSQAPAGTSQAPSEEGMSTQEDDTLMLNSAQFEYLREILTAQQWTHLNTLA